MNNQFQNSPMGSSPYHSKVKHLFKKAECILSVTCLLFIASCSAASITDSQQVNEGFPFLAPTISLATLIITPDQLINPTQSSTNSTCINSLTYLTDLTFPDGSEVLPGQSLEKQWQVENSGTCNWEEGYTVRLIAGSNMGAEEEIALFPALSGSQVVISIIFTAPAEAGTYGSSWQAFSPSGEPFGDNFFISIQVSE